MKNRMASPAIAVVTVVRIGDGITQFADPFGVGPFRL
jgi:hypothetical protein